MDTSDLDTSNIDTSNLDTSNIDTSNIDTNIIISNIIMTPEMQYMKVYTQEKNQLNSTIALQSAEIGRLLEEVQFWKLKYEAVFNNIV